MHFLEHGCSYHHQVLGHTGNLATGCQENSPGLLSNGMILLHNSAWPCRTQQTWKFTQEMLDHPPRIQIWHPAFFSVSHLKGALVRTIGTYNRHVQDGYHTLRPVLPPTLVLQWNSILWHFPCVPSILHQNLAFELYALANSLSNPPPSKNSSWSDNVDRNHWLTHQTWHSTYQYVQTIIKYCRKKCGDIFKTYSEQLLSVQTKRIQRHKTSD